MTAFTNLFEKRINPDDLFLTSPSGSYTYGDLQGFSDFFLSSVHKFDVTDKHPIGLSASSSDMLVFIIASCWIHNIPFISFNPDGQQIGELEPGVIITDKPSSYRDLQTLNIHTFDLAEFEQKSQNKNDICLTDSGTSIFGYFFTSGTSGKPKIVPLKRRQMMAAAKASATNFRPHPNEAWLLCMPLNHVGGISVILRSLLYGSAIYRIDGFSTGKVAEQLSENPGTVAASLVPTMLKRLLDDVSFKTHSKFKAILLGGGPISNTLLIDCINRNIPVIPSYGMTETCAQIAANPLFNMPQDPEIFQSAGTIFESNQIEIRSEDDKPLKTGSSGSVWLKGLQVFDGYFQDKQNALDEDGWFNTGDFGCLDRQGHLYIEARRTDLIISGGENISPFEVEDALQKIDAIKEAAVFGVPDEEWGQKVVAAIVFNDGQLPSKTLQNELKKHLEAFKIPKKFIFVDSLPKTRTGKIKRAELLSYFKLQK